MTWEWGMNNKDEYPTTNKEYPVNPFGIVGGLFDCPFSPLREAFVGFMSGFVSPLCSHYITSRSDHDISFSMFFRSHFTVGPR